MGIDILKKNSLPCPIYFSELKLGFKSTRLGPIPIYASFSTEMQKMSVGYRQLSQLTSLLFRFFLHLFTSPRT